MPLPTNATRLSGDNQCGCLGRPLRWRYPSGFISRPGSAALRLWAGHRPFNNLLLTAASKQPHYYRLFEIRVAVCHSATPLRVDAL